MICLSEIITKWLKNTIGSYTCEAYTTDKTRNQVWKIYTISKNYFLKVFTNSRYWHQEVYAYTTWSAIDTNSFPVLEGVYKGITDYAILTSQLEGQALETGTFGLETLRKIWNNAGSLARRIYESGQGSQFGYTDCSGNSIDFTSSNPVDYYHFYLEKWINKLMNFESDNNEIKQLYNTAIKKIPVLKNEKAHPVHTDYTPGNWIVDKTGKFIGIVDLEDMRWGLEPEAFVHLLTKNYPDTTLLEKDFFNGYGYNYPQLFPDKMFLIKLVYALSTLVQGYETSNEKHILRAKRIIYDLINYF